MTRIAIIGAGITGLGTAYLLNDSHDITLYERESRAGGHARALPVSYNGHKLSVDTGFIVFNKRNYPHLTALFAYLGVPIKKSTMTFGVTANNNRLEWGAQNLNALFGQRRNLLRPKFWRLLIDILRFNALAADKAEDNPDLTLGELINQMRMGAWFAPYYLLPMGGAIWSCPLKAMLAFPAVTFTRFFKEHGLLTVTQQPQWYTVDGGSTVYVEKLSALLKEKMRLNQSDLHVTRSKSGIAVVNGTDRAELYDHVIFACAADEALKILGDPTADERRMLSACQTQKNIAVLHKDTSLMPKRKRCWSSWVYHAEPDAPVETISVTYWMNALQSIDDGCPLFVTLNPLRDIAAGDVFDTHHFWHPVYTQQGVHARNELKDLQGQHNTWFGGAWTKNGFHEDGLSSAVDIAAQFGVTPPWV